MQDIHPKVSIPAFGGAVVGIAIYELKRRGIEVDAVEGSFITLVVTTLLGFLIPSPYIADHPAEAPEQPIVSQPYLGKQL